MLGGIRYGCTDQKGIVRCPDHGYKIIKDIKPYLTISESTLYPILRRLEEGGYLTVNSQEHNGRLRKYYSITAAGLKKIDDFAQEWKQMMEIYDYVVREVEAV